MDQSILESKDTVPRNPDATANKIAEYILEFNDGVQNQMLKFIKEVVIEHRKAKIEKAQIEIDFLKGTLETLINL
jgi:hypothetical protein